MRWFTMLAIITKGNLIMKSKFLALFLSLGLCSVILADIAHQNNQSSLVGVGYSSDTQDLTSEVCFNSNVISVGGQEGILDIDGAISFQQFQQNLRIDVTYPLSPGLFSNNPQDRYFRSIKDTSTSLSFNYYQYAANTVRMQPRDIGLNGLTDRGRDIYLNSHSQFGVLCGDYYLGAYQQGAILAFSLNVKFDNEVEKQRFQEAARDITFPRITAASNLIQQIVLENKIKGSISVQAFQIGGEPSQLGSILSPDPSGSYYFTTCNLQNMNACTTTANDMWDYVLNIFPTQISFEPGRGLAPLWSEFATYDPIRYMGLTAPPSFVTPVVIQNRRYLAETLNENEYYESKLSQLLQFYPVSLDTASRLYRNSQTLLSNAANNINAIVNSDSPQEGALGCFTAPYNCEDITRNIRSRLIPILPEQLTYLNQISKVVAFRQAQQTEDWYPYTDNPIQFRTRFGIDSFEGSMDVTAPAIRNINLNIISNPPESRQTRLVGGAMPLVGNGTYSGNLCMTDNNQCQMYTARVIQNPFYFGPYQPTK
jgi:hypothetical protein